MKVMIPVDMDQSMVAVTFGRAPYFVCYDTETDSQGIHRNPAVMAKGGAGIKAAQFIVDAKADALIATRCGQNSADVLGAADVKIYKSSSISVKQNIEDLKAGKLTIMDQFTAGNHGK